MALKKLPSEVETMTLPQYYELCEYWLDFPPEGELLAMLASVYTTWKPYKQAEELKERAKRQTADFLKGLLGDAGQATIGLPKPMDHPFDHIGVPGPGDMGGVGPFPGGPVVTGVKIN